MSVKPGVVGGFLLVAFAVGPAPVEAQSRGSFAWEVLGGTLGSAAGFGLGYLARSGDDCGEDLECILEDVAFVLVTSSLGAGVGAIWGGRRGGGEPSIWGGLLGGAAGAVAGLAVVKVLDEAGAASQGVDIVVFNVSQGFLAALGAHLLGGS